MPIYEYVCDDCKKRFEEYFKSSSQEKAVRCPECGSGRTSKQFSAFAVSSGGGGDASASSPCCSCQATGCASRKH